MKNLSHLSEDPCWCMISVIIVGSCMRRATSTSSSDPHLIGDVAPDTVASEYQDEGGESGVKEEQVVTGDQQQEEVLVVAAVVQFDGCVKDNSDEVGGVTYEECRGKHDDCYCHLPVAFLTLFLEQVSPHIMDYLPDLQDRAYQADNWGYPVGYKDGNSCDQTLTHFLRLRVELLTNIPEYFVYDDPWGSGINIENIDYCLQILLKVLGHFIRNNPLRQYQTQPQQCVEHSWLDDAAPFAGVKRKWYGYGPGHSQLYTLEGRHVEGEL